MFDLSHAFVWRGAARYWDVTPKRKRIRKKRIAMPRRPCVNVLPDCYAALVLEAERRGCSIRALVDLIFADSP